MKTTHLVIFCTVFLTGTLEGHAQRLLLDEWFWPDYQLVGNAANRVGENPLAPKTPFERYDRETEPLLFQGQHPTERIQRLLSPLELPVSAFTLEAWIEDHVNRPIGSLVMAKSASQSETPAWALGYYNRKVYFYLKTDQMKDPKSQAIDTVDLELSNWRGYKRYFAHLVAAYDGDSLKIYINGEEKYAGSQKGFIAYPEQTEFELAAYLGEEPYMELGNHLLHTRLWDAALSQAAIQERFSYLQQMVERGERYPDLFHFTGGPYLHHATQEAISLTWETNLPSTAKVAYGKNLEDPIVKEINQDTTLHTVVLEGLEPETRYYYEITAEETGKNTLTASTSSNSVLSSGVLSFSTARADTSAYSFSVFGDTEARPHINFRMSELVWGERPDFLINLGDLTDGGREPHKFEWNYEYFVGMTPLASRLPIFPVPGNGEGDLYWYKRYHSLPNGEAYYTFTYGNAQFFMLNSNERAELEPGGKQFEWLERELKASTATWKFACHHHPVYTSDENDYGDTWKQETSDLGDLQVRELAQLYEKYQVDMVMYGHLHTYERTWPVMDGKVNPSNGVVYLVAGGAGGNLEDFAPTRSWFSTKVYRGHHYVKIDIFENELFFKMYDLNGALKDYMELRKE